MSLSVTDWCLWVFSVSSLCATMIKVCSSWFVSNTIDSDNRLVNTPNILNAMTCLMTVFDVKSFTNTEPTMLAFTGNLVVI